MKPPKDKFADVVLKYWQESGENFEDFLELIWENKAIAMMRRKSPRSENIYLTLAPVIIFQNRPNPAGIDLSYFDGDFIK